MKYFLTFIQIHLSSFLVDYSKHFFLFGENLYQGQNMPQIKAGWSFWMTSLIHHLMPALSSVSHEPLIVNIAQHQGASVLQFCPLRKTNKSMLKMCQAIKWGKKHPIKHILGKNWVRWITVFIIGESAILISKQRERERSGVILLLALWKIARGHLTALPFL